MPTFDTSGSGVRTPFGKNEYLRSTQDVKTESAMCARSGVPTVDIDGSTQKPLQPGTIIAKITSGPDAGMFGAFQAEATDGRQTAANIVGINETFLPWQLLERDCEIAYTYDASVVQAWCIEYDADGDAIPLTNATRDAMLALPGLRNLRFS